MLVLNSRYQKIEYLSDKMLFIDSWTPASVKLTADLYKSEMLEYVQKVEEYRPHNLIVDTTGLYFSITPIMQEWTDKNIFPRVLASGLRKVAIVVSPDLMVNMGVEQAMETPMGTQFLTRYFDDLDVAIIWITAS